MRIYYCDKCETRLSEEDIEAGRALIGANEHTFCVNCAPADFQSVKLPSATSMATPRPDTSVAVSRRTPVRPSKTVAIATRSSANMKAVAASPKTPVAAAKPFPIKWAVLGGAGLVLALGAALYSLGVFGNAPKPEPAPAPQTLATGTPNPPPGDAGTAIANTPTPAAPPKPVEPAEPPPRNMFEEMAREHRREMDPEQRNALAAKKLNDANTFRTQNPDDPWTFAEMLDRVPKDTPSRFEAARLKRELKFPDDKSLTPGWFRDWTVVSNDTVNAMQNTFDGRRNVLQTFSSGSTGEVLFSRRMTVPENKPFFSITVRCEDKGACLFVMEVEGKKQTAETLKGWAWRTFNLDLSSLKGKEVTIQLRLIAMTSSNPSMYWTPPIFRDTPDMDVKALPYDAQAPAFVRPAAPPPPPPRVFLASKTWKDSPDWKKSVKLLSLFNPQTDAVAGLWKRGEKGELLSNKLSGARLGIAYKFPDQYDIRATVERKDGSADIALILNHAGKPFIWTMGANNNNYMAISMVKGKMFGGNPASSWMGNCVKNGARFSTVVEVRKDRISTYVNGRLIQEWTPSMGALSIDPNWKLPDGKTLGVGAWQSEVAIYSLDLIEVK